MKTMREALREYCEPSHPKYAEHIKTVDSMTDDAIYRLYYSMIASELITVIKYLNVRPGFYDIYDKLLEFESGLDDSDLPSLEDLDKLKEADFELMEDRANVLESIEAIAAKLVMVPVSNIYLPK